MKQLLIDAIVGADFPTIEIAVQAQKAGLARYTGTQHSESWAWIRSKLDEQTEEFLQTLYQGLREAREPQTVILHAK